MTPGHGRPLRFLGIVTGGWIGMRVVLLWPAIDSLPALVHAVVPVANVAVEPVRATGRSVARAGVAPVPGIAREVRHAPVRTVIVRLADPVRANPLRVALALLGLVRFGDPATDDDPPDALLPGIPKSESRPAPLRSRWSGSAWLVARGGNGIAPGSVGGQLGGSQAGFRLDYTLDRKHRLALAGRVTTPLGPGMREAAVGVEWQPTHLPVRLVAEQRAALNGGSGGPALGVVGGFGPTALPGGFHLESYGQAGAIRRATTDLYADGAARATHSIANLGGARLAGGAGAWAAAQRGAARVDVGPSLVLALPVAHQPFRLSLDYRIRIAGDAYPGSGPALTLGADF